MTTPQPAPATAILGRGLYAPRLGAAPFDAVKTLEASGRQAIIASEHTTQWTVPGTDLIYNVPINIDTTWIDSSTSNYTTYENADEATADIEANASLEASYLGFEGDGSTQLALKSAFASSSYIAMFAYTYDRYSMSLNNQKTLPQLFDKAFINELQTLPQPFDGTNSENFNAYSEFLYRWGTHLVTEISFGQRFFFSISQTTTDGSTFSNFQASVSAEYDGFASIKGDASFRTTPAYETYAKDAVQSVALSGGSHAWHAKLAADPSDREAFVKWASGEDAIAEDKPQHLQVQSIANILRLTSQGHISRYAEDVELATSFITSIRETPASGNLTAVSRPMLFVKVHDDAKAPGQVNMILSNDVAAAIIKFNAQEGQDVWGPPLYLMDGGFEYGLHGRSISFQGYAYKSATPGTEGPWDVGNMTRFSLQYGSNTTITLHADENVEYVIFASGNGSFVNGSEWPAPCWRSRHVYWVPSVDPNPLILKDVDLSQGAAFQTESSDIRGQFAAWEMVFGLQS